MSMYYYRIAMSYNAFNEFIKESPEFQKPRGQHLIMWPKGEPDKEPIMYASTWLNWGSEKGFIEEIDRIEMSSMVKHYDHEGDLSLIGIPSASPTTKN